MDSEQQAQDAALRELTNRSTFDQYSKALQSMFIYCDFRKRDVQNCLHVDPDNKRLQREERDWEIRKDTFYECLMMYYDWKVGERAVDTPPTLSFR